MRKKYIFGKKLYISILTSILVLLTTVATTFAWVGVFANSTFEKFDVNIKISNLIEYGLEISLTGEEGTFSDSIDSLSIKKAILVNWGYNQALLDSASTVENLFSRLEMEQCTTLPTLSEEKIQKLGKFYDSGNATDFKLDVYLNPNVMTGREKQRDLFNSFSYPSTFINPYDEMIQNGTLTLPSGVRTVKAGERIYSAKLDSSTATRVAFEKYKVVDKYDVSAYSSADQPMSTIIYHKGYEYPVYYENQNMYNFGAILPDEINLATAYFNSSESRYLTDNFKTISIPNDLYNIRGVESNTKDISISRETNHIINSSNPNETIGMNQMIKLTVSFWFEGWDADCFKAIAASPVSLNIVLSASNEDDI